MFNLENLSDDHNLHNYFRQAIKAHALMKRDRDYVVKDGEVIIVDEFTGRLMFGRRYSDGLHQAIEAKENVKVARESRTMASITFQNYFRMYAKLAGMTGTAATEEEEFRKIYGMDVVSVPTNMPMIRHDSPDAVYRTERGKFQAVVEEIAARHQQGQPVLVGTISIAKSEELSQILTRQGIRHHVLNAKHHEKEAEIVAQAGQQGAVTIATNMAGRGTDIVLGGNPEPEIELARQDGELPDGEKEKRIAAIREQWQGRHAAVVERGGLHIVGTERHESRRIDNQLRGRSGRQGDPGSSRFFVSLEDDLMRLFGADNAAAIMEKLGMEEDVPVEHPLISRAIENAQKKVEGRNFEIRKHILEYDDVLNMQREVIYRQRRQVLEGDDLRPAILEMITGVADEALALYADPKLGVADWDLQGLRNHLQRFFPFGEQLPEEELRELDRDELRERLVQLAADLYAAREKELGDAVLRELERVVLLRTVDEKWMNHIDEMHELRQGVGLRGYGQQNPLVEYQRESYEMFQHMIDSIKQDVVRLLFHIQVGPAGEAPPRQSAAVPLQAIKPEDRGAMGEARGQEDPGKRPRGTPVTVSKIGRNEPCPCGSGKKYKKCCG
jgi:preprotein translocase subunit SecA